MQCNYMWIRVRLHFHLNYGRSDVVIGLLGSGDQGNETVGFETDVT